MYRLNDSNAPRNAIGIVASLLVSVTTVVAGAQAPPPRADVEASAELDGNLDGDIDSNVYTPPPPVVHSPPPPVVHREIIAAPQPVERDDDGIDWMPNGRPGTSFGLGIGWVFPGPEVWTPNTVATRFRLESGLTVEPNLRIEASGSGDNIDLTTDDRDLLLAVGAMLRVPLASVGPVDFLFLGTLGLAVAIDLEPGDTTSLGTFLGYGLGLEFWLTQRWSLGMDATNSLLTVNWTSTDDGLGGSNKQTDWSAGLVWNPSLRLLVTLYL